MSPCLIGAAAKRHNDRVECPVATLAQISFVTSVRPDGSRTLGLRSAMLSDCKPKLFLGAALAVSRAINVAGQRSSGEPWVNASPERAFLQAKAGAE